MFQIQKSEAIAYGFSYLGRNFQILLLKTRKQVEFCNKIRRNVESGIITLRPQHDKCIEKSTQNRLMAEAFKRYSIGNKTKTTAFEWLSLTLPRTFINNNKFFVKEIRESAGTLLCPDLLKLE
ncbi:hypothetical protein HUJ05_008012 [Dendroctonus ponderosae]|nr:hypothetical protein HUJ05_008012 [Dendroctonus ponderosae]